MIVPEWGKTGAFQQNAKRFCVRKCYKSGCALPLKSEPLSYFGSVKGQKGCSRAASTRTAILIMHCRGHAITEKKFSVQAASCKDLPGEAREKLPFNGALRASTAYAARIVPLPAKELSINISTF